MKATIEVESKKEADLIKTALEDPQTRALVQVLGALLPLREQQRERVLMFVHSQLNEDIEPETEEIG